jgi:hypothetical protein
MTLLDYHRLRNSYADAWDLDELTAAATVGDASFPAAIRELIPAPEERFPADIGADLTPLDTKLMAVCETYRQGSAAQRTFIRALVSRRLASQLMGFGVRMATLAVARRSPEMVRLALLAHAIEDLAAGDIRDNLCQLAVIADAARRTGADPGALFAEAADVAGAAIGHALRGYVTRDGGAPSLSSMGYRAVDTPEGVRYRQVMWGPPKATPSRPAGPAAV